MSNKLQKEFGNIDIYLFDQLLKGRFDECRKVLDAGCGEGRNLLYFLKNHFEVYGIDVNPSAIEEVKAMAQQWAPHLSAKNFIVAPVEDMPFEDDFFDLVISSAVLHFAKSRLHFEAMLHSMWRVLKRGGFLFARLASNIGIENLVTPAGEGKYHLPDGSIRFLVDEQALLRYTKELNGFLYEPFKTTNVQQQRCMTTWCIQKNY